MPASLFPDMDRSNSGLEDQRALQLAFELSMLGLSETSTTTEHDTLNTPFTDENRGKKSQNMTECVPVPSSEHVAEIVGRQGCKIKALRAKTNTYIKTPVRGEEPVFVVTGRKEDVAKAKREILSAAEHFSQIRASRKNTLNGAVAPGPPANVPGHVTIQVRVPYRVVGLVVGPKGATIKRIQHQTHTYIVTPSRDKEPVFEVTGLPENVEAAKKEIEAHIAMRTGGLLEFHDDPELRGMVDGFPMPGDLLTSLCKTGLNGMNSINNLNTLNSINAGLNGLASRLANGLPNSATGSHGFGSGSITNSLSNGINGFQTGIMDTQFASYLDSNNVIPTRAPAAQDNALFSAFSSSSSSSSSSSTSSTSSNNGTNTGNCVNNVQGSTTRIGDLVNLGSTIWNSLDRDEGIGESPSFENTVAPNSIWSDFKPLGSLGTTSTTTTSTSTAAVSVGSITFPRRSNSVIGTSSGARFSPPLDSSSSSPHPPARRISSDPLAGLVALSSASTAASSPTSVSPTDSVGSLASMGSTGSLGSKRECLVCGEREIVAALVPCGHNLFCMECANRVCDQSDRECPVCHQTVMQAIRIFS